MTNRRRISTTEGMNLLARRLVERVSVPLALDKSFDNTDAEDTDPLPRNGQMTKEAEDFNKKQIDDGALSIKHITELVEYWQKGHGLLVDGKAGGRETIPSINWELGPEVTKEPEPPKKPKDRGAVVPLTPEQVVKRALYLAGKISIDELDPYVRKDGAPKMCPDIFYLLKGYNGGKDPTASDPADRWSNPGSTFVNRTCDCSGGNSWMHGFDRYQPVRGAHVYDGWFNTDSKIIDAKGPQKCFKSVGRPDPGTIIVCQSGSPGHTIGHEGCVVGYRGDLSKWDPKVAANWALIDVVDVAAVGAGKRANTLRTGRGWAGTGAMFLVSVMRP